MSHSVRPGHAANHQHPEGADERDRDEPAERRRARKCSRRRRSPSRRARRDPSTDPDRRCGPSRTVVRPAPSVVVGAAGGACGVAGCCERPCLAAPRASLAGCCWAPPRRGSLGFLHPPLNQVFPMAISSTLFCATATLNSLYEIRFGRRYALSTCWTSRTAHKAQDEVPEREPELLFLAVHHSQTKTHFRCRRSAVLLPALARRVTSA